VQPNGSLTLFPNDPHFALSSEVYALAQQSFGGSATAVLAWLTGALLTPAGGVMDSTAEATATSNIAGFALMALTAAAARSDWAVKVGGTGGDLLRGAAGKRDVLMGFAGADDLRGGGGDDLLVGGAGQDRLSGGTGRDVFVFNAVADSANAALRRDLITDFKHNIDTIDLSSIDANAALAGDQAFQFLGTGAFSRHAGEIVVRHTTTPTGEITRVLADLNGDGRAEFTLDLTGNITLTAGDFLL